MRGACDVEEKSIRAISLSPQRYSRRVARGPERKLAQSHIARCRVNVIHLQQVDFGAGVGDFFANAQPGIFSCFIE